MNKYEKFIDQYHKEYNFLYENKDNVAGFKEAVKWFDDNQTRPEIKEYMNAYHEIEKDLISSDREAGAFAFACEALNII